MANFTVHDFTFKGGVSSNISIRKGPPYRLNFFEKFTSPETGHFQINLHTLELPVIPGTHYSKYRRNLGNRISMKFWIELVYHMSRSVQCARRFPVSKLRDSLL